MSSPLTGTTPSLSHSGKEKAQNQTAPNTEAYHFCFCLFRPKFSLTRMKKTIFAKQRLQQSGFTPGRSTLDRIIALRLLAERRHEYRQPAYIDLRAAFDSLDRNSLWNIRKTIGIPPKLVDMIKTRYSSTQGVARVNGTISEAFSISSGVRQGALEAIEMLLITTDKITAGQMSE